MLLSKSKEAHDCHHRLGSRNRRRLTLACLPSDGRWRTCRTSLLVRPTSSVATTVRRMISSASSGHRSAGRRATWPHIGHLGKSSRAKPVWYGYVFCGMISCATILGDHLGEHAIGLGWDIRGNPGDKWTSQGRRLLRIGTCTHELRRCTFGRQDERFVSRR